MIENQTWLTGILKFLTQNNLLCLLSPIWIKIHFSLECLSTYFHCLTRWLVWSYFLPQKIEMYHLQIILHWILNHQISGLCILGKTMVQVQNLVEPLLRLRSMKSIARLEQFFASVDISVSTFNNLPYVPFSLSL